MTTILTLQNVKKTYKDGTIALKGISLEITKSRIFALLGPNGAGKTTLISIITTLLSKTSGQVYVENFNLDHDADKIREIIGVTFQEQVKEQYLTGREVLYYQGVLYGIPKNEILKKSETFIQKIGLQAVADKPIQTYSGGMYRRLEIIKGLLSNPKILFLDEPTLGLDPQSRRQIWKFINELKASGTTIFVTSHYIDEIEKNTDEVAIIDMGKIIEAGTPKALIKKYAQQYSSEDICLEDIYLAVTGKMLKEAVQ